MPFQPLPHPLPISDILDHSIGLCRQLIRPIVSALLAIHLCNLALVGLIIPFLNVAPLFLSIWFIPMYLGNVPAFFFFLPFPGTTLQQLALLLSGLDLILVQSWCSALFIPWFARRYLPTMPDERSARPVVVNTIRLLIPHALLFSLIGLGTLLSTVILPNIAALSLGFSSMSPTSRVLRFGTALTLFVVITQALYSRIMLAPHVRLLEGASVLTSFRRSWMLTSRAWLRATAVALSVYGAIALLTVFPAFLAIIRAFTGFSSAQLIGLSGISRLIMFGYALVILPVQSATTTILYYELRMRREGYDLELLLGQSSSNLRNLQINTGS